jgi:hypothetical protein
VHGPHALVRLGGEEAEQSAIFATTSAWHLALMMRNAPRVYG